MARFHAITAELQAVPVNSSYYIKENNVLSFYTTVSVGVGWSGVV